MTADTSLDVAIIGGGVAGLWILNLLCKQGRSAMLFESDAIGGGQSIASQGIIHGGLKYALDLKLGQASAALADMPGLWRDCLQGKGAIDLRGCRIAAEHHLFWVRKSLTSRIAGFFGARMLRGRVDALESAEWPSVLRDPEHVGAVYRLDEIVLDVPSLLRALAEPWRDHIRQVPGDFTLERDAAGNVVALRYGDGRFVQAKQFVFTAGAGNAQALRQLGQPADAAQTRPLHMLLMRDAPGLLHAHCFDSSDKPRVTVTSHHLGDEIVWYVGGQIAENGVMQDEAALIATAKAEFSSLLPGLDLSRCRYAGWQVDRAEGATETGAKPDGPVFRRHGNVFVAWPTKLALAPRLADAIIAELPPAKASPLPAYYSNWPQAPYAQPVWERVTWR
ncbi:FAD-dependent oxidoreductase [Ferrovibrio sp.]|uniref:FAD-dependent oxidoreductase n=1 Tax=Ferrovibrio sp. TaxID=1917215 RepID=UPI0035B37EC9